MIAISAEQTPGGGLGRAHLQVVADASAASLTAAARATIAAGSVVQSDAWKGYAGLGRAGYGHHPRRLPSGADIDRWLPFSHIVLSNFKRWTHERREVDEVIITQILHLDDADRAGGVGLQARAERVAHLDIDELVQ